MRVSSNRAFSYICNSLESLSTSTIDRAVTRSAINTPCGSARNSAEPGGGPQPVTRIRPSVPHQRRDVARSSSRGSEPMTCLAEAALCNREDLCGSDRVHEGCTASSVVKATVAHLPSPSTIPLDGPRLSETFKHLAIDDRGRIALDHHVEPSVPLVGAGRQNHMRVAAKVDSLLFSG